MPVGIKDSEPYCLTSLSREDRRLRIATDLSVGQNVREIKVPRLFEWCFRRVVHAFPEWFSAIVQRFLRRVFRIFRTGWAAQVRHRTAVREPHVDIGLELQYEFTERRAVRLGNCRLRTRGRVF